MNAAMRDTADYTKFIAFFLGFICFVVLVFILMSLKEILVPVTIAVFLTLLFHPVVEILHGYKVPKWLSIILILLLITTLYYLLILLLLPEINILPQRISDYVQSILPGIQKALQPLNISVTELSQIIGINLEQFRREEEVVENIVKEGIAGKSLVSITSLMADLTFTLIFWSFMIAGKKKFELRLQKAFSENRREVIHTITTIDEQMQYFILLESIIGLAFGTFVSVLLKLNGIEFAILFGFLAFILNFIPKIGVVIGALLPLIYTILGYGFSLQTIVVIVCLALAVFIIAKYVEPHFLGKYINLSPVFVLFSLIFWGWIWGIAGLYLAFPIAAVIKIFFSNIESLRPLAIIIGSRVQLQKDVLLSDNGSHEKVT